MIDGKLIDDVVVFVKILSDVNIMVFVIGIGRNYDI